MSVRRSAILKAGRVREYPTEWAMYYPEGEQDPQDSAAAEQDSPRVPSPEGTPAEFGSCFQSAPNVGASRSRR